jgi:hypothetical protein
MPPEVTITGGRLWTTCPSLRIRRLGFGPRIGVDFTQEATPPWLKRRRGRYSSNYTVRLDVSVDEVTQAAESWIHDLAGFPERHLPAGSLAI